MDWDNWATIRLDEPAPFRDQHLEIRELYPLTLEWQGGAPIYGKETWLLDADLQVVGHILHCQGRDDGSCRDGTSEAMWLTEGQPAAYGIGLLWKYQRDGRILDHSVVPGFELNTSLRHAGDRTILELENPSPYPCCGLNRYFGTYGFDEDPFIPASGPQFRIKNVTYGDVLPLADRIEYKLQPETSTRAEYVLFPDERVDLFGLGISPRGMVDLLSESGEIEAVDWDAACVTLFDIYVPEWAGQAPGEDPVSGILQALAGRSFDAAIGIQRGSGATALAELEYTYSGVPPEWTVQRTGTGAVDEEGASCRDFEAAPRTPVAPILDAVPALGVEEEIRIFTMTNGLPRYGVPRAPEAGWAEYWFYHLPQGREDAPSFFGYLDFVTFEAIDGSVSRWRDVDERILPSPA